MNLLQDISTKVYTYEDILGHTYVVHRIQQPIPDFPIKTISMYISFCQVKSFCVFFLWLKDSNY